MANEKITDYPNSIVDNPIFDISEYQGNGKYKTYKRYISDFFNLIDQGNLRLVHDYYGAGGTITNTDINLDEKITPNNTTDYLYDFTTGQSTFYVKASCRFNFETNFAKARARIITYNNPGDVNSGLKWYGDFFGGFESSSTAYLNAVIPFFLLTINPSYIDIGFTKSVGSTVTVDNYSLQIYHKLF